MPANPEGCLRGGTIGYWRRLLKNAGRDWTNVEYLTRDRKAWKSCVRERRGFLYEWEEKMSQRRSNEPIPNRTQGMNTSNAGVFICKWENCGKVCKNKTGLTHHERRMHKEKGEKLTCTKCGGSFSEQSNLTNHQKVCDGAPPSICGQCGRKIHHSNLARHKKLHCPKKRDQFSRSKE